MRMLSTAIKANTNNFQSHIRTIRNACIILLPALLLCAASNSAFAQTPPAKIEVPDWALPGSATHKQVPPPSDFHRPTRTDNTRIGIFEGQSDVGAALVPGSSSYNAATTSTPSSPQVIMYGMCVMNSAISGKKCPAMYLLLPT